MEDGFELKKNSQKNPRFKLEREYNKNVEGKNTRTHPENRGWGTLRVLVICDNISGKCNRRD